jgi:hypothetical protein
MDSDGACEIPPDCFNPATNEAYKSGDICLPEVVNKVGFLKRFKIFLRFQTMSNRFNVRVIFSSYVRFLIFLLFKPKLAILKSCHDVFEFSDSTL